jgi:hypothetical protein
MEGIPHMPTTIFDAGDMNAQGICRAWACEWIKKCKQGVAVTSKAHLDSQAATATKYQAGAANGGNDGIDAQYGLVPITVTKNTNTPLDVQWIGTELTKGTGYFLFAVRGKTLNVAKGSFDNSGHAMATRKGLGPLQFFDPNLGVRQFDNSVEFYNWLPKYIKETYPGLLSREGEVKKFK